MFSKYWPPQSASTMHLPISLVVAQCCTMLFGFSLVQSHLYDVADCLAPNDIVCTTDCKQVASCTLQGDTFTLEPVEICNADQYCYLPLQRCAYHSSCAGAEDRPFVCTSAGLFPDPYDCADYHACLPDADNVLKPQKLRCEDGDAFSSYSRSCAVPRNETYPPSCVLKPVATCLDIGQSGSLVEASSMYYVCVRDNTALYPVIHECPHGGVYNDASYSCEK